VKLSLCLIKHHAIKTYSGSEGIAPRVLNLSARWKWAVSLTPRYTLDRRLELLAKRIPSSCRESNLSRPARSLVTIPLNTHYLHVLNNNYPPFMGPEYSLSCSQNRHWYLIWAICIHSTLYHSISLRYIKVKVKLFQCSPWAPRHEGVLGEWRYSSTHSLTSALDGGEWSASQPE
jgi:hypothetical protein